MESSDVNEGMEVIHPFSGRGYVAESQPQFGAEPDGVTVQFYGGEIEMVPVYTVRPIAEVATASLAEGLHDFEAITDDGRCTLAIEPDGTGSGYTVEVSSDQGIEVLTTLTIPEQSGL